MSEVAKGEALTHISKKKKTIRMVCRGKVTYCTSCGLSVYLGLGFGSTRFFSFSCQPTGSGHLRLCQRFPQGAFFDQETRKQTCRAKG